MIYSILALINAAIFLFLSLLHFYWVFGGTWGLKYAMPEEYKVNYFNPEYKFIVTLATLVVGVGLLVCAMILSLYYFNPDTILTTQILRRLTQIIGAVFILRAIGDFNMAGLFKKKRNTPFAIKDSQFFVPLCLYLGITSIIIGTVSISHNF